MSTYDLEEQERISALKDWWDQWGTWVTAVLVAGVVILASVFGYREYQKSQADQAEVLFRSVKKTAEETAASKEVKKLSDAVNTLAEKFPGTFQATEGQLMAAKATFDAGDFATTKTHLQWVIDKGRETHRVIAQIRLATVLLETKDYEGALKMVDAVKDEAFIPIATDLKGDIFAAQGKRDEARAAYQTAVEKSEDRSALKAISQAKLDAAGGPDESKKAKSDTKSDTKSDAKTDAKTDTKSDAKTDAKTDTKGTTK